VTQAINCVANSLFDLIAGLAPDQVRELRGDSDAFQVRHEAKRGKGLEEIL
jgi:hypothetical protein